MSKTRRVRHWLFKSEPSVYGWDHFVAEGRTIWTGVRNYQARNLLRDDIQPGDRVLFYHSNAKPTAVVGIARVVRGAVPDPTQFDEKSPYFDAGADPAAPRWYGVEIEPVVACERPVTRDDLRAAKDLDQLMVLQKGARLSVQPVSPEHWRCILALGGVKEPR